MKRSVRAVLGALILAASASAIALEYKKGDLRIDNPWTRATAGGQTVAAGYLEIVNAGKAADRVIGASTPAAERIELHVVGLEGEVMRMREVKSFEVPAGGRMELKPRGPHMMIMGIKRAFKKDERIPVTLRFEKAGDVAIELLVGGIDAPTDGKHKH
ncbi:MAG: copper chaperone PCu(A)C [Betaproteobacteria bacterium]|nr:copper chaperone PCu(A)C [Betaproteobacteria bacterium]